MTPPTASIAALSAGIPVQYGSITDKRYGLNDSLNGRDPVENGTEEDLNIDGLMKLKT